mmetsp:Transcript_25856/g.64580  ORF Transcript_25856/g.64580 Transcript_25856/m.64580 type:complete len:316 (+) Transcript_25856:2149-3096(+)
MRGVERLEVLVGESRDVHRVAAAVVVIRRGREQRGAQRAVEPRRLRPHRALHLVEHDALEHELGRRVVHVLELEAVPLLQEILPGELGEERGVEVHAEEVEVIGRVHGGKRVAREVRGGHGVHESAERPPQHVEEGVADGVLFAAAQRGVLEDVRDAAGVDGGGAERDVEDVVGVVRAAVQPPRTRLGMQQLRARHGVLGNDLDGQHLEGAVRELLARDEGGDGGDGGDHRKASAGGGGGGGLDRVGGRGVGTAEVGEGDAGDAVAAGDGARGEAGRGARARRQRPEHRGGRRAARGERGVEGGDELHSVARWRA